MGDRANVYVRDQGDESKGTYLYTHGAGEGLLGVVHSVIKCGLRWGDAQYLSRMIFERMMSGAISSETGFGISATMGDNGHPLIVVDCTSMTIGLACEGEEPETFVQWKMEEFNAMDGGAVEKAWDVNLRGEPYEE